MSIQQHVTRKNNPHNTNKEHVGLSNIQNYPKATVSEIMELERDDRYINIPDLGTVDDSFRAYMVSLGLVVDGVSFVQDRNPGFLTFLLYNDGGFRLTYTLFNSLQAGQTLNLRITDPNGIIVNYPNVNFTGGYSNILSDSNSPVLDLNVPYLATMELVEEDNSVYWRTTVPLEAISTATPDGESEQALIDHMAETNPHGTNKTHVGLSSVANQTFMTVAGTKALITTLLS